MTEEPRNRLRRLLAEFLAYAMETEAFRIQFEQTCNMELDKTTLSPAEAEAFAALFEEVVWYSPFPEERARIPSYRGEAEIRAAAESAAARIGMTHETT